jgi:Ca2+-binding EF-hand superfamily protein
MTPTRLTVCAALGILALSMGTVLAAAQTELMSKLDTDHDATVDMNEAKAAGSSLFDKLDRDHDGTLTRHELSGRLSVRELGAADPDHDKTLSKDEYLAVIEQRFKTADPDNDGTLSSDELRSKAGAALLRLLKK